MESFVPVFDIKLAIYISDRIINHPPFEFYLSNYYGNILFHIRRGSRLII